MTIDSEHNTKARLRATSVADGLRQLADWVIAHPEVEVYGSEVTCITRSRAEMEAVAQACGDPESECSHSIRGTLYHIDKKFGPVKFQAYGNAMNTTIPTVIGEAPVIVYAIPGFPAPEVRS